MVVKRGGRMNLSSSPLRDREIDRDPLTLHSTPWIYLPTPDKVSTIIGCATASLCSPSFRALWKKRTLRPTAHRAAIPDTGASVDVKRQ